VHTVALHIARKHAYRGSDLEDLERVAALGLIQAVDRFEPDRGIVDGLRGRASSRAGSGVADADLPRLAATLVRLRKQMT